MKRTLLALVLSLVGLSLAAPALQAQNERDPEDRIEVEAHFGVYGNISFPDTRQEATPYTTFLTTTTNPAFLPLFRPNLDSENVLWQAGWRLSYDFRPQWSVEYGFDITQDDNFQFAGNYLSSVVPERLTAVPTLVVNRLDARRGRLMIHSFNLVYHTRERGRVVPYLTGGLNIVTYGFGPGVQYRFADASAEVDTFGYEHRHTKIGGNVGGGLKVYVRRHFGVRADVRFLFAASRFTQRGAIVRPTAGSSFTFGPDVTSTQRGLYTNLHATLGLFGRW